MGPLPRHLRCSRLLLPGTCRSVLPQSRTPLGLDVSGFALIISDYVFRCTRRALQTDPTEVAVEVIILEHLVLDPYTHEEDQPPSLQQKSRELLKLSGGCLSSSIS